MQEKESGQYPVKPTIEILERIRSADSRGFIVALVLELYHLYTITSFKEIARVVGISDKEAGNIIHNWRALPEVVKLIGEEK